MTRIALIQLISEQTVQNLLPICALQPHTLIHLTTDRTALRSTLIKEAATSVGIDAYFERVRLSDMPRIAETGRAVQRCIETARQQGFLPVLNFTGGTKLMSIGAYQKAADLSCPSFYVDTLSSHFIDGNTAPGLADIFGGDLSFSSLREVLSLDMLVVANGHRSVSKGRPWRLFLPSAHAFRAHPSDTKLLQNEIHRKSGLFPGGLEPRSPADWVPLLSTPFYVPAKLLDPLLESGLLVQGPRPETALLPQEPLPELHSLCSPVKNESYRERYFAAIAPVQQAKTFLEGGWWEVLVAEAMDRSGVFRDLRWSACVTQQNGVELEEDVLAVTGTEAVCVSCKSSGYRLRLHPALEELNSRAKAIGGSFTKAFLAVASASPPQLESVRARARELRIQILTPDSLHSLSSFAEPLRGRPPV
jgi:hypothetical protein